MLESFCLQSLSSLESLLESKEAGNSEDQREANGGGFGSPELLFESNNDNDSETEVNGEASTQDHEQPGCNQELQLPEERHDEGEK